MIFQSLPSVAASYVSQNVATICIVVYAIVLYGGIAAFFFIGLPRKPRKVAGPSYARAPVSCTQADDELFRRCPRCYSTTRRVGPHLDFFECTGDKKDPRDEVCLWNNKPLNRLWD